MEKSELVCNRRAYYDYEVLETFEAGLVLVGTEVKSLRAQGGNLAEAYVRVISHEVWLVGASISPYKQGNIYNHELKRDRKLLMSKHEIRKLKELIKQKGLTIIPLKLYFKKGKIKLLIASARGKKNWDKRGALIERERKRETERAMKRFNF